MPGWSQHSPDLRCQLTEDKVASVGLKCESWPRSCIRLFRYLLRSARLLGPDSLWPSGRDSIQTSNTPAQDIILADSGDLSQTLQEDCQGRSNLSPLPLNLRRMEVSMHSLRPYVFLSYSRADDEPFVEHLRARLEDAGISVWWDRASMESRGRRFLHEIQEAIEHCDRLIAVIGPGALSSPYVRYEWEHALLFARAVTPVLRLVNYKEFEDQSKVRDVFALNDDWSKLHCVDFRASRPFDEACEELLRIARTLAAPLGNLYGVPALPPNLLPRPEQLQAISDG